MYKHILLPTDGWSCPSVLRKMVFVWRSRSVHSHCASRTPLFYPSELHASTAPQDALEHEKLSKENARRALDAIGRIACDAGVGCTVCIGRANGRGR